VNAILTAARALIASIADDTGPHGGLQSRETVRRADELRLAIARFEAGEKQELRANG
jgi:hypothetical protein